jgi:hypothetical protein
MRSLWEDIIGKILFIIKPPLYIKDGFKKLLKINYLIAITARRFNGSRTPSAVGFASDFSPKPD